MNCTCLLQTFFKLRFVYFLPDFHVDNSLTKTLGHTVITTPLVLDVIQGIDVPYVLASYGDIVDDEITGAIMAGEDGFIQEQIAVMTSQTGWKARAMVILITLEPHPKFFRYLWRERVMNVIMISKKGKFAYNPFNDTMFSVDGISDIEKILEERWRDLQGYKVAVAMYRHNLSFRKELGISLGSGIDGSAIFELAKYWNMTVDIVDTGKYHFVHAADRMLHDGKVDLSMNARFLSRERKSIEKPEYTTSIYTDSVVIVLRTPDKLRGWAIFGKIFHRTVWLALLVSLVVMNRTILWMGRMTNWSKSFWSTLKALCNTPITRLPRSSPDRIVLLSAFLVGMVIVTIFQASLYHSIKEGVTYKRMKTIPEVLGNFQLVTDSEIIKTMIRKYDLRNRKLKIELKVVPLKDEVFNTHGFVTRALEIKLLIETGELRDDLYLVDQEVCNIPLSYLVKRGSPYLNRLSDFTSRVFEGGLWNIWYRMTLRRLSRGKKPTVKEQHFKVLSLRDVEVAFFVLILGNFISIIVFLLELLTKAIHDGKLQTLRRYITTFLNFMYPTQ